MDRSEAEVLALRALAHILGDQDQADRLLALTGLDPAGLRARANDPALLGAVLDFLANHEPSLVACADAIGVKPGSLIAARGSL